MSESHQVGSSELGRWRTEAHVQENFSEPASWGKAHSWTSAILFLQEEEEFNSKCIDFFAYYLSLKWVDRIVGHWWFPFALGRQGIPHPIQHVTFILRFQQFFQLIPIPERNFFVLKCQQNHNGLLGKNCLTASQCGLIWFC